MRHNVQASTRLSLGWKSFRWLFKYFKYSGETDISLSLSLQLLHMVETKTKAYLTSFECIRALYITVDMSHF